MRCLLVICLGLFSIFAFARSPIGPEPQALAKESPYLCQAMNFDNQVVDQLSVLAESKLDAKNIYMLNHNMNPAAAAEGIFISFELSRRPGITYEIKTITCLPAGSAN